MRNFAMMLILLLGHSFAMDIGESLEDVKILRIMPNNTIIINRGAEDFINTGEHLKLKVGERFITRAIAVQVNMQVSYLKLYRVANPDLINTDRKFDVHAINTSEVPVYVEEEVQNNNYYANLEYEEMKLDQRIDGNNQKLASDLPPEMDAVHPDKWYRYMKRDLKPYETPQYEERKVSDALVWDNLYYSIYAAPYQTQRLNDQRNINYGLSLGTKRNEKYELTFNFSQMSSSSQSQFDPNRFEMFSTNANVIFDINRVRPNMTYFMLGEYYRERNSSQFFGSIYPVREQLRLGLAGVKYYIYENEPTIKRMDISYIPVLERRVSEFEDYLNLDGFGNPTLGESKVSNIRHSVRFRIRAQLDEKTYFTNTLFWRPNMNTDDFQIDFQDIDLNNTMTLSYQFSQNIFFDYVNTYTYDIRLRRQSNIEPYNMINSFNLRYTSQ
jgi:hypothetical protein